MSKFRVWQRSYSNGAKQFPADLSAYTTMTNMNMNSPMSESQLPRPTPEEADELMPLSTVDSTFDQVGGGVH